MTRDEFKSSIAAAIDSAIPTNTTITTTNGKAAFNNIQEVIENTAATTSPTIKVVIRQITDVQYE